MLVSLALTYTFTVYDYATGLPIEGAQCAVRDYCSFDSEGYGAITDHNGICQITIPDWFSPAAYSVYATGYETVLVCGAPPVSVEVAMTAGDLDYWVSVAAGLGGMVDWGEGPKKDSSWFKVAPGTLLTVEAVPDEGYLFDYWRVDDVQVSSSNPETFEIDHDSCSIRAVFSEEPHQNGPPPPPPPCTFRRTYAIFSNFILKAETWDREWLGKTKRLTTGTPFPTSAMLRYSILYLGGTMDVNRVRIRYNGDLLLEENVALGESITGSFDVTGRTLEVDQIRVGLRTYLFEWDEVQFSVWMDYCYESEPTDDPAPLPDKPEWWKWMPYIAVGVVALSVVMRPQAPQIVMPSRRY